MSEAAPTAASRPPSYEPFGWHQWHEDFWMSYQFRRGLGETQEGGGAVSEVFQAASKITPNDFESWHREWTHIAERNNPRRGAGAHEVPYLISHGVNATLRLTREEETGAEHCQHDNPTLGQELMIDWLADVFGIDQTRLAFYPG